MSASLSTRRRGAEGEARAAAWLEARGWRVLERNFRSRWGEIDLIVARADEVAFVEVKSWRSVPLEDLERSVGPRKRARIIRTASQFLSRHPDLRDTRLRFDVVFLGADPSGIRHFPGAFSKEGID